MYSFVFLQGIFFTDIGRNASRCLHTHARTYGRVQSFDSIRYFYLFFSIKETELYNGTYGTVPNLWWDLILNSKYIHIIRLRYLLNVSHTYEFIYLYIFQTLINADQFYREVNERYGIVQHSTVRYMVIVILSKGYNFSNSNLLHSFVTLT